MKNKLKLIVILLSFTSSAVSQITIDDTKTAAELVTILTSTSNCIITSNPSTRGDNYTPGENSFAQFDYQGSNFPFKKGIVLSTWSSKNSVGPYVDKLIQSAFQWRGDNDIDVALVMNSINATVLEFDFVAHTNSFQFNYFLASNEYKRDYPCKFSDGFAFLIKENFVPNDYVNIATIPNTNIPVATTTIHPEINFEGVQCAQSNQEYFGNFNTDTNNTSPINYAGQTKVLTAKTTVTPGKSYHIKLIVADDDERYNDSAIFIDAGSFASNIDIGKDQLIAENNGVCFGETYTISTKMPASYGFKWFKNDSEILGATSPNYTVTSEGNYRVEVYFGSTCSQSSKAVKIEFTPEIVIANSSLLQCDADLDGISYFDLSKIEKNLRKNNSNLTVEGYFTTLSDATLNQNSIINYDNYQNTSDGQIIFARIQNQFNCTKIITITLLIEKNNYISPQNYTICEEDAKIDGITEINLASQINSLLYQSVPTSYELAYYQSETDAIAEINFLPTNFTNNTANQQTIFARIINGSDCMDIIPITLHIKNYTHPPIDDFYLCFNQQKTITLNQTNPNDYTYLWSTNQTTNSIDIKDAGEYFVAITNAEGCKTTLNFDVSQSEFPKIDKILTKDLSASENTIEVSYTTKGEYEFSLDGDVYQKSPIFKNIAAGLYTLYMRDSGQCNTVTEDAIILDYPRVFTPNNDNYNDVWALSSLPNLEAYFVTIFDRYGKIIYQFNTSQKGWDGTYLQQNLPADDYWFALRFLSGKTIKGHFSLKR